MCFCLNLFWFYERLTRKFVYLCSALAEVSSPAKDRPLVCLSHHEGEEKTPDCWWGGPVSQGGPLQSRESWKLYSVFWKFFFTASAAPSPCRRIFEYGSGELGLLPCKKRILRRLYEVWSSLTSLSTPCYNFPGFQRAFKNRFDKGIISFTFYNSSYF